MLVKRRTMQMLIANVLDEQDRLERLRTAWLVIQDRFILQRKFRAWIAAYRHRMLIKRVLHCYCQGSLWRAWTTWVRNISDRPPPSPRPIARPPPPPATPHTYKRRGSRLPRVPPHIVVPLMGLQSYAMVHDPKVTPQDRIAFRIHRVAHHEEMEEAREKPPVVAATHAEQTHASMALSHASFATPGTPRRSITPEVARRSAASFTPQSSASPKRPGKATPKTPNPQIRAKGGAKGSLSTDRRKTGSGVSGRPPTRTPATQTIRSGGGSQRYARSGNSSTNTSREEIGYR